MEHMGGEVNALSPASNPRQSRPGVQLCWLVRMILQRHQVVAQRFALLREVNGGFRRAALRRDDGSKLKGMTIMHGRRLLVPARTVCTRIYASSSGTKYTKNRLSLNEWRKKNYFGPKARLSMRSASCNCSRF